MDFSEDQIHRYARHILLKEVGGVGQEKLLDAKVLLVGAGVGSSEGTGVGAGVGRSVGVGDGAVRHPNGVHGVKLRGGGVHRSTCSDVGNQTHREAWVTLFATMHMLGYQSSPTTRSGTRRARRWPRRR